MVTQEVTGKELLCGAMQVMFPMGDFLTHQPGICSNNLIYDGGCDGQRRRKSSRLGTPEK